MVDFIIIFKIDKRELSCFLVISCKILDINYIQQ